MNGPPLDCKSTEVWRRDSLRQFVRDRDPELVGKDISLIVCNVEQKQEAPTL
jgi:hypothetical protein